MNLREAVSLTLPPMELKGKGTSTYTKDDIEKRWAQLRGDESDEASQERAYLVKLLEKMDP